MILRLPWMSRKLDLEPYTRKTDEWNRPSERLLLTCALIFLASVLLYSPTLQFDFARYDDHMIIGEHPQLYSDGTIFERVAQIVYLDYPREEPLIVRDLSWLVDSELFGYNRPFGYHYGNVVYHSITLVLAFLLILRLTGFGVALGSTMMLLVLAAHIEPVAWIMGRKDILSALFSMLCILLFLDFQETCSRNKRIWLYMAALFCAGAAYLSKVNAVILPGVLFCCALIANQHFLKSATGVKDYFRIMGKNLVQVLPFFLLGLAVFLWYRSILSDFGLLNRAMDYNFGEYSRLFLIVNPLVVIEYIKMVFLPWNLEAFYSQPSIFVDFSVFELMLAAAVFVFGSGFMVFLWFFSRRTCLLLLCFAIILLPYMNWIHQGFWYANRYVYFAAIFLLAATFNLVKDLRNCSRSRLISLMPFLLLGGVFAYNMAYRIQYINVWENGETLWRHEVSIPGASIHDYNNLTAFYIGEVEASGSSDRDELLEKARLANEEVFQLDIPRYELPWLSVAHYYRGLILAYSDAPLKEQLAEFLEAVNTSSNYARALRSTGVVYFELALEETNEVRKIELASKALHYFREYFAASDDNATLRRDRSYLLSMLKKQFAMLSVYEIEEQKD